MAHAIPAPGEPARLGGDFFPTDMTVGPDGLYLLGGDGLYRWDGRAIEMVRQWREGTLLDGANALDVAEDGTVYVSQNYRGKVVAVTPNGNVETLVGENCHEPLPDDPFATDSTECMAVSDLDAARDGTVYLASGTLPVVAAVAPDGTKTMIAGSGASGALGTGTAPNRVRFGEITSLDVDRNGDLLILDGVHGMVRAVKDPASSLE
jgi:hypothetical protein